MGLLIEWSASTIPIIYWILHTAVEAVQVLHTIEMIAVMEGQDNRRDLWTLVGFSPPADLDFFHLIDSFSGIFSA